MDDPSACQLCLSAAKFPGKMVSAGQPYQIWLFAARTELMQDLKEFNGSSGGGLKNFDKLVDALAAVGVKEVARTWTGNQA